MALRAQFLVMPVTFRSTGLSIGQKVRALELEGKLVTRAAIASKVRDLIEEGFILEKEPRGHRWTERTRRYPWGILSRTGKMRSSFRIDAGGPNLVISNDAEERGRNYPVFHQFGWHLPGGGRASARQFMPVKEMTPRWKREIDQVVAAALERLK
jgi:phage gpG-like protein